MPTALGKVVIFIDVIFSYLYVHSPSVSTTNKYSPLTDDLPSWLTAFIFAAQDYNRHDCYLNAPPGLSCSKKKANEAFIFLTLYVLPPPLRVCPHHLGEKRALTELASSPSSACSSRSRICGPTRASTRRRPARSMALTVVRPMRPHKLVW